MSEWIATTVGALGKVVTGKTPSKNNPEDWGNEYHFITPSDYGNYNKYANHSIRGLSEEGYKRHKVRMIPKNSCLVTCIGSDMGKVVLNAENAFCNQQINALIPNPSIIDNDYAYYFFKDLALTLKTLGSDGTAVPILNKSDFEKIELSIPPLLEQKAIASVLSSLDDKIDLLHRQNKTLEAMAETLFRQWFIEEAKEDWICVELGTVVETSSGGTPSRKEMSYYEDGSIHWVKSKELNGSFVTSTEEMITDEAVKKSSAKLLPAYSTLIAMYGATVGEYALITKPMTCNQAVCAIKENEAYPYTFIFMYVKNQKDELINQAVGSAQQNISQILIKKLPIPTCTDRIYDYHQLVHPWFKRMQLNIEQIQTLENLRDTLLPKLMSGEVRVQYQTEQIA